MSLNLIYQLTQKRHTMLAQQMHNINYSYVSQDNITQTYPPFSFSLPVHEYFYSNALL